MKSSRILLLILGIPWIATSLPAQDVTPAAGGPNTIEFSFSNPGARSMGFGGAFAALADDATAAFANPAGLVQLVELEISLEARQWSFQTPFTEGGRVSGSPTGIGIDDTPGLRFGRSDADVASFSFLSLVYPLKKGSLAFYRHQLARFEATAETQGLFDDVPGSPGAVNRELDSRSHTELEIVSYGVAGAYRLTESFSVGLTLTYSEATFRNENDFFTPDATDFASFFLPNSYSPSNRLISVDITGDNSDFGLGAGFLWRVSQRWSLGGVVRQGPELELTVGAVRSGPALAPGLPEGTELRQAQRSAADLPNVYGLGVAFRSKSEALTLSFEWDRVEYSRITASFDPEVFDPDTVLRDGDELHLGVEYVVLARTPIVAFRLGAWVDPDHRFDNNGDDLLNQAVFQAGEDELHYTLGVGMAFRKIQIDLAADFSDLVDTVSLSAIYSF